MTTAYREETIVAKEGTLLLKNLPFVEGDAVEVIVLSRPAPKANLYPLRGTVLHYDRPFAPAVEAGEPGCSSVETIWSRTRKPRSP